jgi:hypothetical protein
MAVESTWPSVRSLPIRELKMPGDGLWGAPDAGWEPSVDSEQGSNTNGEPR